MEVLTYSGLRKRGIPYTRQHLRSLIKDGKFPASFLLVEGGRTIAWNTRDIDDWLAARMNARQVA